MTGCAPDVRRAYLRVDGSATLAAARLDGACLLQGFSPQWQQGGRVGGSSCGAVLTLPSTPELGVALAAVQVERGVATRPLRYLMSDV